MTTTDETFSVYLAGEQINESLSLGYIYITTPLGQVRMTPEEADTLGCALQHAAELDRRMGLSDEDAANPYLNPYSWAPEPALTVTVYGTPAGQGQISFLGKGRGARHTNEKTLKPWRAAIIRAVRDTTGCHGYADWKPTPKTSICLTCRVPKDRHGLYANIPTRIEVAVTVPKPKSAPKRKQTWPITRYSTDIDHHARACLDSLSESGVIKDDSQVLDLLARKVYPGEHPDALDQPGAIIRLYTLGDLS